MSSSLSVPTLADVFARSKDNTLLIRLDGSKVTYGEFWQRAEVMAQRLVDLGLNVGDRLMIVLENSEHYLTLYVACCIAGVVACPQDTALPPPRLKEMEGYIQPKLVVNKDNLARLLEKPSKPVTLPAYDGERDFFIIFSSGTTGAPKGIVHCMRAYLHSAHSFGALSGLSKNSVVYHHLPMFYNAGVGNLFFCPVAAGATIVLGDRFSTAGMIRFWEMPRKFGVNHLTITPTMALALAHLYRPDDGLLEHLQRYEAIIATSSVLHVSIAQKFLDTFGVPLRDCYGVTELGGSLTLQPWEEGMAVGGSMGRWSSDTTIETAGTKENPAELFIKTPFMMKHYLIEGKTIVPFDEKGRFATGDLGYFDDKGALFGTGRKNDAVKKGGEFVNLTLIENLVLSCKLIAEASVVPVPDEQWGNRIILFFVPVAGATQDSVDAALADLFAENLRKMEFPDKIIPVPWFPKTAIGKTVKRELLSRYGGI